MENKEEYYQNVLKNRKLMANPKLTKCSCPHSLCDWHGKCKECVAIHVYYNDHVPFCLQNLIDEKLQPLIAVTELTAVKKPPRSRQLREYVKQRDKEENEKSEKSK